MQYFTIFFNSFQIRQLIAEKNKLQEKNVHLEKLIKLNGLTTCTESLISKQLKDLRLEVDQANTTIEQITTLNDESKKKNDKLEAELNVLQELCKDATNDNCELKKQNELLKQSLEKSQHLVGKYREDMDIVQAQVLRITIFQF